MIHITLKDFTKLMNIHMILYIYSLDEFWTLFSFDKFKDYMRPSTLFHIILFNASQVTPREQVLATNQKLSIAQMVSAHHPRPQWSARTKLLAKILQASAKVRTPTMLNVIRKKMMRKEMLMIYL